MSSLKLASARIHNAATGKVFRTWEEYATSAKQAMAALTLASAKIHGAAEGKCFRTWAEYAFSRMDALETKVDALAAQSSFHTLPKA